MIPTRSKAKLPRHLSYPIGAEAISEALAGVPHFEAFTVVFYSEPVWPSSEFRRLLVGRLPYPVMRADYRPASKPGISGADHMVEAGYYDETWELEVYPVLGEFRHLANRLLREAGLPAIAAWLKASDRGGWTAHLQGVELVFNPADESLASRVSSGV